MGIINEMIGLIICVLIGFGYGLIASYFDDRDSSQWITNEMAFMLVPHIIYLKSKLFYFV